MFNQQVFKLSQVQTFSVDKNQEINKKFGYRLFIKIKTLGHYNYDLGHLQASSQSLREIFNFISRGIYFRKSGFQDFKRGTIKPPYGTINR